MAENLNVNVNVNTNPAIQALNRLQQQVQTLENKFSGLGAVIAGLGVGVAIRNTILYADALQDLSDSTSIAVSDLVEFQKAVELSGGNAEKAQQAVGKLTLSIDEAAQGGKKVQQAFSDVGVSINDLRTLSEKDILQKTINGLSQITDASKRAALAQELLGKSARGLNYTGLSEQFGKTSLESIRAAENFKKLAEFQDKLDRVTQRLRESLANTLGPFIDKINEIPQEKLNQIVDSIIKIGSALTTIAVAIPIITRLIQFITVLGTVFAATKLIFNKGVLDIAKNFLSLGTTVRKTAESFSAWWRQTPRFAELGGKIGSIGKLITELGARLGFATGGIAGLVVGFLRLVPAIAAVTTAVLLLNEAVKLFTDKGLAEHLEELTTKYFPNVAKALNDLGEMLGMGPPPSAVRASEEAHKNEMARIKARIDARAEELTQQQTGPKRKVISAEEKELSTANLQLRQQAETLQLNLQIARDRLSTEAAIIKLQGTQYKLSEDELVIRQALRDIDLDQANAIRDITKEIEKLNLEMKLGSEDKTLPGRIALLEQQKNKINEIYNIHKQELPAHIQNLRNQQVLEQDRLRTLENITQQIEQQISRQQTLDGLIVSASEKFKDVQFGGQQMGRSPLEQQFAQIQEEARKAAYEAGRVFAQAFEDSGDGLTPERANELAIGLQQIADKYKLIADEQTKQLQYSQTWEAGWSGAFKSFAENATNAANMARDAFSATVNAMNSAIDRFVETGKFSFKDFASSIIQELIKIELKAAAMQIFKYITGGSAGGSIIGSIFSGLGFANGGQPPMNKMSLVGEKGPELFMPKQPGTIIPNDQLGQYGRQEQVVNNYYTYNVSAIDNKSVAQFFAEHRKTMLGTVQLAQKEMPYNNR